MWNDSLAPEISWIMGWTIGHCPRVLVKLGWEIGKKWSVSKPLTWRQGLGRAWIKMGGGETLAKGMGGGGSLCWALGTQMAVSLGSSSHWRNPPPHYSPLPDLGLVTVLEPQSAMLTIMLFLFFLFGPYFYFILIRSRALEISKGGRR